MFDSLLVLVKMGITTYQKKWEESRPWLKPVHKDIHKAHCIACYEEFRIDRAGEAQVNSHASGNSHKDKVISFKPTKTIRNVDGNIGVSGLSEANKVLKAEIINLLRMVEYNISFSSASQDNERFRVMFPDSDIAKKYHCSSTKVTYLLNYGLGDFLREKIERRGF